MRSRRKPIKPGDQGQLSQIHITKRSYKSSRGGVSVNPGKINPSLTIQGHQHGIHGGQSLSNNNKKKIHSIIQGRNTVCPFRLGFTHVFEHTLAWLRSLLCTRKVENGSLR